jgi:predicted RND superfamily exporter protein
MWAKLAGFILRYRLLFIVLLVGFTSVMLYQAGGVRLYYGLPRMLPDDDATLQAYDTFRDRFKEESTVFVIGIEKDLFNDTDLFNKWYELGRSVSSIDGVDTVLSVGSAFNIKKDTIAKKFVIGPLVKQKVTSQRDLDSLKAEFEALPFYKNLIYNSENNYSLMAISMKNERFNSTARSEFFGSILSKVRTFEEENQLEVIYSGMPYIRETMTEMIKQELRLFVALTLLVTIIILLIFFRSIKPVLISMTVVGLGVIWSLGMINSLGYEITILTSLIPPLIIVIGIPNCIYLINKFHSELKTHRNKAKALTRVVTKIGKATFMTNATTGVGFLTFTFTESVILVEFGIVAFLSIMSLFTLSILVITISFSYMAPPKDSFTDHLEKNWITNLINWLKRVVTGHRTKVYGVFGLGVVVAFIGLLQIETTGNIVDDLPKDHPIVDDLHWFESNFGGVVPFEIQVDAGKPKQIMNPVLLKKMEEVSTAFEGDPSFSRSISIVDALKFVRQAFYNGNPDRYDLISSRERAFFKDYVENANADQGLLHSYVDSTEQFARISLQVADIGTHEMDSILEVVTPKVDAILNPKRAKQDSLLSVIDATENVEAKDSIARYVLKRNGSAKRSFIRLIEDTTSSAKFDLKVAPIASNVEYYSKMKEALNLGYTDFVFTGPSITFLKGTNYLVRNLFVSLSIAIVIVALLMAAVFNSFRMIVVSVVTNLIPLLFTGAVMGYFGVAIKPSTLLVFSIAFGISVDDTIHFLAKYRQELRYYNDDIGLAVRGALNETGVSMVYTSIILFFGFSVFDSSQFGGTQALGLLVSLTMLVAMFANLILLPSFLMTFEKWMVTKTFQEPLFEILNEEDDIELDELDFSKSSDPTKE